MASSQTVRSNLVWEAKCPAYSTPVVYDRCVLFNLRDGLGFRDGETEAQEGHKAQRPVPSSAHPGMWPPATSETAG